ncbi:alcohol dehydrogenase GroES-like domain protein [Mycobacterium ulcerans str. Harvey]|uniref:Alcohol dehydrogenase GroES-like domain protein n=1 Tax=Mycobacterium ulcerans str. Harvey TaxID=1299332 RepID=A0ABP3A4U3_MYCUL|nr:alcohol dehydrogenase GroES-like domain protein [Mycobacterium ulcerans str. Harvey]
MRAIVCDAYGPPEDLVLDEVPDPVPAPGQVLVRVRAVAVNFPDVLFIAGKYQIKIPPPFVPGNEIAGEVVGAGAGVILVPGQRVFGTTFGRSPSWRCSTGRGPTHPRRRRLRVRRRVRRHLPHRLSCAALGSPSVAG